MNEGGEKRSRKCERKFDVERKNQSRWERAREERRKVYGRGRLWVGLGVTYIEWDGLVVVVLYRGGRCQYKSRGEV